MANQAGTILAEKYGRLNPCCCCVSHSYRTASFAIQWGIATRKSRMSYSNTFKSASSRLPSGTAVEEIIRGIGNDAGPPSIVAVFASTHHLPALADICESFTTILRPDHLIGCTGISIVANAEEIEDEPCLSMLAAWLPGALRPVSDRSRLAGDHFLCLRPKSSGHSFQ